MSTHANEHSQAAAHASTLALTPSPLPEAPRAVLRANLPPVVFH